MNRCSEDSNWKPVDVSDRYAVLDLLRGLALFGVLIVNLLYFFRLSLFAHILHFHSHPGWINHAIDLLVAEFIEFKAFDLFSLTFGIGIAIQAERARRRNVSVEVFLLRRFVILAAFGVCHMVLISNVDILTLYAVCGLLVIPLLRLPVAVLALAGLAAIYLPSMFGNWPSLPPVSAWPARIADATRIYSSGSFGAIVGFRWRETREMILPLLAGVAQNTFGLMLIGVAVWRSRLIEQPSRYQTRLRAFALGAGAIGLFNVTAGLLPRAFGTHFKVAPFMGELGYHAALCFAYAAALLGWRGSEPVTALTAPIAAAGRMALTNYLTQSIVFCLLFYGYGFGLFGRLDTQTAAAIGVVFYLAQLWFSTWWLSRYRFGPFEWLWRSLTYGRRQLMRQRHSASVDSLVIE